MPAATTDLPPSTTYILLIDSLAPCGYHHYPLCLKLARESKQMLPRREASSLQQRPRELPPSYQLHHTWITTASEPAFRNHEPTTDAQAAKEPPQHHRTYEPYSNLQPLKPSGPPRASRISSSTLHHLHGNHPLHAATTTINNAAATTYTTYNLELSGFGRYRLHHISHSFFSFIFFLSSYYHVFHQSHGGLSFKGWFHYNFLTGFWG